MEITTQIISDFRTYYPEFADDTVWTAPEVERALEAADDETGSSRWGSYQADPASFKARGLYAYAAHYASLMRAAKRATENGGIASAPAQAQSKTVGDESISYAIHTPESGARSDSVGGLNTTIYGQEFLRLRNRAGMGAVTTGMTKVP